MTLDLLDQILVTKERYGYMACPCLFANGAEVSISLCNRFFY
jgi:ferredoxin-thioredoxin reductase catalytic subunit